MKDHYADITKYSRALNNHWKTRYSAIWRKSPPANKIYSRYANQTIDWAVGENKNYLNPDYKDVDIKYSIDANGFRVYPNYTPTSTKKVFTYGCSMTFGFSLPDEHTWPYLIAKKLGDWRLTNYGVPAAGPTEIARVCYQSISCLKKEDYPDVVFVYFPDFFRTEHVGNEDYTPINTTLNLHAVKYPSLSSIIPTEDPLQYIESNTPEGLHLSKVYSYYNLTSSTHSFFEMVKSFKLIKETLESRNIPWFWYTWSPMLYALKPETVNLFLGNNTLINDDGLIIINRSPNNRGRDGSHVGLKYTDYLSTAFMNLFKLYENREINL